MVNNNLCNRYLFYYYKLYKIKTEIIFIYTSINNYFVSNANIIVWNVYGIRRAIFFTKSIVWFWCIYKYNGMLCLYY